MSFLFVFHVNCLHISLSISLLSRTIRSNPNCSGGPLWQPKVVPGPILVAKFGPARASFGKMGPFLETKIGPGITFG